ncbi:MAG: hypothetical protein ABIJ18_03695 [archaeon]
MEDIQYKGLKNLDSIQIKEVQNLCENELIKIKRELRSQTAKMFIDIHLQEKDGKREKFSFHIRILNPTIVLTAKHSDFQIMKALHKSFDNLKTEGDKKFRKDVTKSKVKKF